MTDYCYSKLECDIIHEQIKRRAKYRLEFLKQRTDPCKHSQEAGYVFDPAVQRYLSMKTCQFDHFQVNSRSISFGIVAIVIPMFVYGCALWKERDMREQKIRSGELRYRDRLYKLC